MQSDFWQISEPTFAGTREGALRRLNEFSSKASRYGRERNHVVPGHTNVSRLSPAIRHRLITETEVAETVLKRYAFSTVEKFIQEVYWRRYWKSWLAMRPLVWGDYLSDLDGLRETSNYEEAAKISSGRGPVAVMNGFCQELIETGYLHNHARMWFAGYWIHTMRLPWQLGADFFYRHLLDADPASNTLSWRWVAGLQTAGKTYLARRSNIEKYLHPEILEGRGKGLDLLENGSAANPEEQDRYSPAEVVGETLLKSNGLKGLWIHEEDLSVEGIVGNNEFEAVLITGNVGGWNHRGYSELKKKWLEAALDDTRERCAQTFGPKVDRVNAISLVQSVSSWAKEIGLSQVVAFRPEVGSINDELPLIRESLSESGISLVLLDRKEDLEVAHHGKAGFFRFWKNIEPYVRSLKGD